jgi:hypothetical protein
MESPQPQQRRDSLPPTRRSALLALLGFIAACGGGGSGSTDSTAGPMAGSVQQRSITAQSNADTYPLNIYLPPASAGNRATLHVVYLLDGESRFAALVAIVEASHAAVIIVGIGNEAHRNRDYVPPNSCTPGGGGEPEYFDFIRFQLVPWVESNLGGDPAKRILLGHSHGGSFVLYALFAENAAGHHFRAYLASDASIGCMSATVYGWESAYAAANTDLPVRLHIAWAANADNATFAPAVQARHYPSLVLASQFYPGGHIGMIPAAFADALAFALAG